MKFRRINETTINCIISQEDMFEKGIRLDDFFDRKREAMEYLKRVIIEAARQENFNLEGEYTSMRVSVLPDHSLSLTLSEGATAADARAMLEDAIKAFAQMMAEKKAKQDDGIIEISGETDGQKDSASIPVTGGAADAAPADGKTVETNGNAAQQKLSPVFGYVFYAMKDIIDCCAEIASVDNMESSLYCDDRLGEYYLFLQQKEADGQPEDRKRADFERVTLSVNEFARFINDGPEYITRIREHKRCIVPEGAVQVLAALA